MKKLMTLSLVLMIACIFAVAAVAQDDTGSKTQTKERVTQQELNNAHGNTNLHNFHEDGDNAPHGPMSDSADGGQGDSADGAEKAFVDEDMDGINDENLTRSFGENRSESAVATEDGELWNVRRPQGAQGTPGDYSESEGFGEDLIETPGPNEDSTAEPIRQRGKDEK